MSSKSKVNPDDLAYSGDIASRYLRDVNRDLFLVGQVNQKSISDLIIEMKYLERLDPDKDINLYINSCGGECAACYSLCNVMDSLKCDVATYALGEAMSAAAVILANGTKGKRHVQKHSSVMIHMINTGESDNMSYKTAQKEWDYMTKLNNIAVDYLVKLTGRDKKTVRRDIDRNLYMFGEEAIEYGLADKLF